MGWKVELYSVGVGGNNGAEGPDHAVWLTSLAFFSPLPSVRVFSFSLGKSWLYGLNHCRENGRRSFWVHSKVPGLFRDHDRGLGPCILNGYDPNCCADFRGICLGEL